MDAVKSLYLKTAAFPPDRTTVDSKEALRDTMLLLAPEPSKKEMATFVALHETYDSWSSAFTKDATNAAHAQQKLREYVSKGADANLLNLVQPNSPGGAFIDRFNSAFDKIEAAGFQKFTDPNLLPSPETVGAGMLERFKSLFR